MLKLLKNIKGYTFQAICAPLFKLCEALLELIIPLLIASIIDTGIPSGDTSYILIQALKMVGLGFLGLLFSVTAQYFAAYSAVGFTMKVRSKLFSHIESLSDEASEEIGISTLITRITSDMNQIQTGMNMGLRLLLRSPFIVLGCMVMAFTIDIKCALVFVVVIPLLSVIAFGIVLSAVPKHKSVQAGLDKVTLITRENMAGTRVIRAFNKEEIENEHFDSLHNELTGRQISTGKLTSLLNPLTLVVIDLGLVAVIYVGGIRVNVGAITQGEVVALMNYMSQILVELLKFANLIVTVSKGIASMDRVQSILDMPCGMLYPESDPSSLQDQVPSVSFENVTFSYKGSPVPAISNITFEGSRGETVGIIGGTGSGKSTVASLLRRSYDVSSGSVSLFGNDIRSYTHKTLCDMISIVPQKAVLFKGTVRSNLAVGNPDATDEEMLEALSAAQCYDFVMAKNGLDTVVEQNGENFSGGQKQRLSIARAIIRKTPVLILDDSFSALDYLTELNLREALRKYMGDSLLFIISQRTSTILNADKIIVLDDGATVGYGTHEQLLDSCEIYRDIYLTQFPDDADGREGA